MPYSNYPGGFPNGVTIRGIPILQTNPGRVFWLSNNASGLLPSQTNGSDGNNGTFRNPFATLAYAFTQCSANTGDIIMVKPGHAETVVDATTFALNIAGVAVVGLGQGSSRPTFTFGTGNTSAMPVSADNISFQNCIFAANFLSIASAFLLTTAKNFTLENNLFIEGAGGILNFLNIVKSTGAANTTDGMYLSGNKWIGLGTTSVNSFLLSANTIDRLTLYGNTIILNRTADASILATISSGILTGLDCGNNNVQSQQTATTAGTLINVGGTTSTGIIYRNFGQTLSTTDKLYTTSVGLAAFENYVAGVIGASGYIIPTRDS